ncbi:MAG: hypothetical protein WBB45_21950 [Cyclobacteriaceae bacterium]
MSAVFPSPEKDKDLNMLAPITGNIPGTYTGYVNTVGSCGFSFVDCYTDQVLLLNKSGYTWLIGTYHTIEVSNSNTTCGSNVYSREPQGPCETQD